MTAKVILALLLSLPFISQVSSDLKNSEETAHVSQVFNNRGGDRNIIHDIESKIPSYFRLGHIISRALVPTPAPAPNPNPNHLDCNGLCKDRCTLHSRQNVCMRACGTCCVRCKCVPPGTYGNREMCGKCYTNMTTHGNKPKCP